MKTWTKFLAACFSMALCVSSLLAQDIPYTGPEDPAGDISAIRSGYMNGNRLLLYFENNAQIADFPAVGTSRWPNDYTGQRMIDVASVLAGSQVYVYHDSVVIDDLNDPRFINEPDAIDTLYFVQSHSYSDADPDYNYDRTVEWGIYPVPGYCNEAQDYVAMSNKPTSWPPEGWPLTGFTKMWPGEWNGRFGRGQTRAALESYFVANDAQDMEYIIQRNDPQERLITDGPRYLPRPGVHIGDFGSSTIQNGLPWGGLGLRYETRGYQWSNNEAQDIVFWEYNISNISDYNLPVSGFGYYIDNSIGGDASGENEVGYRDKVLDLSYVWERLGQGEGGVMPGTMGYAYLESPGKPFDGVDDDDDGIIDEKRDNAAGEFVGPTVGVDGKSIDVEKFRNYFLREPKSHWEGDEDQDWQDGVDPDNDGSYAEQDENGNWVLETGAFVGDDVGIDGVGPGDLNYNGPDADGTECNHKPDFVDVKGEPNFGPLDIGESDMLGLTSFLMFDWAQWKNTMRLTLNEDLNVWNVMNSDTLSEYLVAGSVGSMYLIFASSPFPFYKGRTERVSMAFMCAYENLAQLNAKDHRASNLFRLKQVAQIIYERDYQFAQPPIMPTLNATSGDGKVILTWDDFSDKFTREPLLENVNDFEGYKLYKSTDKFMADPQIITDGKGAKKFRAPIFQCDKVDTITGYSPLGGELDGHLVYLGDDTGIRHYFIDTDVQNGRTYYYALVAYDYGIADLNIAPAENMVDIELDESENIVRMGQNIQIVTPGQRAAGYVPPNLNIDEARSSQRLAEGLVSPLVMDANQMLPGHTYKVSFKCDTTGHYNNAIRTRHERDAKLTTSSIEVYDVTQNPVLVYYENSSNASLLNNIQYNEDLVAWQLTPNAEVYTDVFEGLQCRIMVPDDSIMIDRANSGWIQGHAPINIQVGNVAQYFPYDYQIVFDPNDEYQALSSTPNTIYDVEGNRIGSGSRGFQFKYPFYVINSLFTDSLGNPEKLDMVCNDVNQNGVFDWDADIVLVGYSMLYNDTYRFSGTIFSFDFIQAQSTENPTSPGDVYRLTLTRPFSPFDSLCFTVSAGSGLDKSRIKTTMDSIKVVPNPYIATNMLETAVANQYLNQRRQILFTHIPAACTIRIFTSSGVLVDKIDVQNEPANGTVHWNLLSREGLEIAAGMYIFHVKSDVTGDEKVGKFAVIK